jgi:hypothetical protein
MMAKFNTSFISFLFTLTLVVSVILADTPIMSHQAIEQLSKRETSEQTKDLDANRQQRTINLKSEHKVENSAIFHKGPLYWYKKYAYEMGGHIDRVAPLRLHYSSEQRLRKQRDENLNRIDELTRREDLIKRNAAHEALTFENRDLKQRAALKEQEMINSQRSTAIKFEINHDIMWRAYYEVRLTTNQKNLHRVLPDERIALDALINNDKDRIKFYANAASDNWDSLIQLLKKEKVVDSNLEKLIKHSVMKVNMLKLDSEKTIVEIQAQIRKLVRKNIPIRAQIESDENLDS